VGRAKVVVPNAMKTTSTLVLSPLLACPVLLVSSKAMALVPWTVVPPITPFPPTELDEVVPCGRQVHRLDWAVEPMSDLYGYEAVRGLLVAVVQCPGMDDECRRRRVEPLLVAEVPMVELDVAHIHPRMRRVAIGDDMRREPRVWW
jgi:hypothetical protein